MEPPRAKPRFVFVDALRGVAALAVVVFHLYYINLGPMTGFAFPEPFHSIFNNGDVGVYIFFVISGFVIAQSIHGDAVTPNYAGWFALRRSVRLDIPYWATIIAMVALTLVSNQIQSQRQLPLPSFGSAAAHLVYAQHFLGYPHIVGVFWTLCYEVQFYLTLILVTGLGQALARKFPARWYASPLALFMVLWCVSLVCATGRLDLTMAFAMNCWPYFALGVAVNWVHNRTMRPELLSLLLVTVGVTLAFEDGNKLFQPLHVAVAIVTAVAIYGVSRTNRLTTMSLGPVLQYLGRISYSLYLVHMLVGTPSMRFGIRLLGGKPSLLVAIGLMLLSTAISIVAAHIMYVLVERPATQLSRRLRPRKSTTEPRLVDAPALAGPG